MVVQLCLPAVKLAADLSVGVVRGNEGRISDLKWLKNNIKLFINRELLKYVKLSVFKYRKYR